MRTYPARVEGRPSLTLYEASVRTAIASRYLDIEKGRAFADRRGAPGFMLRLDVAEATTWDLSGILDEDAG